jgi:hypothetical protein
VALTEKLQILITADGRGAQQEFQKLGASAERSLGQTDDRLKALSGQMVAFGSTTLVAGGVAAAGLFKLAGAASALEEQQNKANVVLGTEGAEAFQKFAEGASKSANLSQRAATQAGSTFAIFGKQADLAGTDLAEFSIGLTQLAGDVASFNDVSTDEAILAIGAALRGETEPIARFGADTRVAALEQEALAMGIYDGNGALTQQQRILAVQSVLMKDLADASGDVERTSDSLANRQRNLSSEFENTQAAIGRALLPAFESIVGGLSGVTGAFNALPQGGQQAIGTIAGVATAGAIAAGGLALLVGAGLRTADTFSQLKTRIASGEGALGSLGQTLRNSEGQLTAVGKAAQFTSIALAGLAAVAVADEIRRGITNEAGRAATALKELQVAAGDVAEGTSEDVLRSFSELAGAQSDNIFTEVVQVFGKNLSLMPGIASETIEDIEKAFESLSVSEQGAVIDALRDYGTSLDAGSQAAKDNAELLGNLQGRYDLTAAAASAARGQVDGLTGATEDNAEATADAKEASDALNGTLRRLAATQKLSSLQFDVGKKRAEAFADAIERSTNADDLLGSAVSAGRALGNLRETLGLIPEDADAAEEATNAAQETIDKLGEVANRADPQLSDLGIAMGGAAAGADAFNDSLKRSSGVGNQLDSAIDLGEAFRDLQKSVRRLPEAIDLTAIALGELRPRQLDAIADLRAFGAAAGDYLTSMLSTGASLDQVRGQAALFRGELEAQLRQAGLSEEAIASYVEAAMLAPAQIETAIKLSGVEQARFKLNAYLGLLEGKIPPEVATSVIAQIEAGNLDAAASTLKNFAATNPVDIDLTPKGVDKIDEASRRLTDLPRTYDPLVAATGGYTEANLEALDAVLGLGDSYQDTLSQLASEDPQKAITYAERMREQFDNVVAGLGLTKEELESYYKLLGIAKPQVETAIRISINEAELFALTTTVALLTDLDSLSPEVMLELSDALLRNDYDEVRRLLEEEVTIALGLGSTAELESDLEGYRRAEESRPIRIPVDLGLTPEQIALFDEAGRRKNPGNRSNTLGRPNPPARGAPDLNLPVFRATGGPTMAGQLYGVNELGAEMFVPNTPGFVMNHSESRALIEGVRRLLAAPQAGGDVINIYETAGPRQTAEEIIRSKSANRFLAGVA